MTTRPRRPGRLWAPAALGGLAAGCPGGGSSSPSGGVVAAGEEPAKATPADARVVGRLLQGRAARGRA